MVADTPLPTTAWKSPTLPAIMLSLPMFSSAFAASTIALPTGCSLPISAKPINDHHNFRRQSLASHICSSLVSATLIRPMVNVPVLSKITWVTLVAVSRAAPPLTRMPCSAPTPVPTITAVGVLNPKAQGQAKTMTEMHNLRQTINLPPLSGLRKTSGV